MGVKSVVDRPKQGQEVVVLVDGGMRGELGWDLKQEDVQKGQSLVDVVYQVFTLEACRLTEEPG